MSNTNNSHTANNSHGERAVDNATQLLDHITTLQEQYTMNQLVDEDRKKQLDAAVIKINAVEKIVKRISKSLLVRGLILFLVVLLVIYTAVEVKIALNISSLSYIS
jgi:hypothetical protein